jgi:hypothetical protein
VAGLGGLPLANGFTGRVPAAGAPLTPRTLALRPNPQSLAPGPDNRTSSDILADAVYGFLQNHPRLGVPEEGQRNLAEFARAVNQQTPWGSAESAVNSAKSGDLTGTVSNLFGATPFVGAAAGVGARVGKNVVKDTGESLASNLAKRAVLTGGKEAVESAAPEAVETAAPVIKGRVRATPAVTAPSVPDTVAAAAQPPGARNMQQVPDIRGLPAAQAIDISRQQPHIIPLPGGGFVGAPRSMRTMADVEAERAAFDKYVDEETAGGDWYDRARSGLNELTGRDPVKNKMMTGMEGTWSAGVDPQTEIGRVIKEANSATVGDPQRANYTTQHNSLLDAMASADPGDLMHGRKTGQYAKLLAFDQGPPGVTGVNDFRYANQRGFLPQEGSETRDGEITLTEAQHRWLDHETALAVDRANLRQLGGRTNWTGEEIQAMPWVRQKAEALAAEGPQPPYPMSNYQSGLKEALKSPPDYAPGFRFNSTFEVQPGEDIAGHLPDAPNMTPDERAQYARFIDPTTGFGSSMTDPATGRDILYGGQQVYGGPGGNQPTGVSPYVMPTRPMQGFYPNNAGELETNPGYAASPLTSFDVRPQTGRLPAQGPPTAEGAPAFTEREYDKVKGLSPTSEEMVRTAEYMRSVMNSQQSGAGNITHFDQPLGVQNAYHVNLDRPATVEEMIAHNNVAKQFGLPHATDSGAGITMTNFDTAFDPNAQPLWTNKSKKALAQQLGAVAPPDAGPGMFGKTDSIYEPVDWNAREPGQGQITDEMLRRVTANPTVEKSYANNPFLPAQTQANAARYETFKSQTGETAPDIWNTQQLIGEGPNWIKQLQDIRSGKIAIPATTAAGIGLFPAAGLAATPDQSQQPPASVASSPGFDDWWRQLQAQRFSGQP